MVMQRPGASASQGARYMKERPEPDSMPPQVGAGGGATAEARVSWAFERVTGRQPSAEERAEITWAEKMSTLKSGLLPFAIFAAMMIPFINGWTSLVESSVIGVATTVAAAVLKGRHKAANVKWGIVVPGSGLVKAQAEAEGLDRIFTDAGFQWRMSGCSLCFYAGGEGFAPGSRVISSTNRNFEGRQGPGIRTHIASPEVVAASALAGVIAAP